ncbi:hypothetical protein HRI_004745100 [Hibiscus trionum]|uniref:Reverse transcriptase domain-containing protein n=1 Tax=Hibiscus trionum TaxID=183268 RepID=A0A9W7JC79_HIBTR|nr:hypothetical protein HRI_004745100 [Hibiscus trionum]
MGFGKKWRKWIHLCISTTSMSVLVNGSPTNWFKIKRGLRQGCPLSPLLFNIMGEVLNALIFKAVDLRFIKGIQVGDSDVAVSHIQFPDDLINFTKAEESSVRNVKHLLRIFKLSSSLSLNAKKTKLYGVNIADKHIQE